MPNITGFFRPGEAGGHADPIERTPIGGSGGGNSLLNKMMKMKLKLAQEQLRQMTQDRRLTRDRAEQERFERSRSRPGMKGSGTPVRRGAPPRTPTGREWRLASDPMNLDMPGWEKANQVVNEWLGPQTVAQLMMQKGKNFTDALTGVSRSAPAAGAVTLAGMPGKAPDQGQTVEDGGPLYGGAEPVGGAEAERLFLAQGLKGASSRAVPPGTTLRTTGEMPLGWHPPMMPRSGVEANYFPGPTPVGGLPPMEEGTLPGTVPKTGKTTVHKGEIVIPKEQVTSSLLALLTADAQRKGTLKRGGSLERGYQEGTQAIGLPYGLEHQEMVARAARAPGAFEGFARGIGHGAGQAADLLGMIGGAGVRGAAAFKGGISGRPTEEMMMERNIREQETDPRIQRSLQAQATTTEGAEPAVPQAPAAPPETPKRDSREELYQKLRGMPEQIQAEHKSKMSEIEAERLLDILRFNRSIDPQMADSIMKKVAFNMKISDKYSGIARGREKAVQEEIKTGVASDRALKMFQEREHFTGQRQMDVAQLKALLTMEGKTHATRMDMMSQLQVAWTNADRSERNRILQKLASVLVRESLDDPEMPNLTQDEAGQFGLDLFLEPSEMQRFIQRRSEGAQ